MRLLDTEVKYIDSDSVGIPKLTNSWGCLIDFLDATLINGSEIQEILSITTKEDELYPELYWKATITLNERHGFKENLSVISITEASDPTYNREFRVQEVTSNTIDIAFLKTEYPVKPNSIENTLGIRLKLAPLGYQKAFSAPQKAVYKVTTKEDKYCYLRVDNSCPAGHDPSWTKFGRVSMLSDMKHIDDYEFKLGRQKVPTYSDNYNKGEETAQDMWIYTKCSGSAFYHRAPPSRGPTYYTLYGDSETFYIYFDYLQEYNPTTYYYSMDAIYTAGRYKKLIYKEDPLPFLMLTLKRYENTDYIYGATRQIALTGESSVNKYVFSTQPESLFSANTQEVFLSWWINSPLTGQDTRINYKPYKNELNLNLMPFFLKMERVGNTVLEGQYRGICAIMSNIADSPELAPKNFDIFEEEGKYYIRIPDRSHDRPHQCIALQLNNWE